MAKAKREQRPTSDTEPATQQQVVDLLTSILTQAQARTQQISSSASKPLEGDAAAAVELFREIGATLAILPSIRLTADPARFTITDTSKPPFSSTLTWSSTEAGTISIDRVLDDNTTVPLVTETPAATGSVDVSVTETTTFRATATARAPCDGAQVLARIVVDDGRIFE
jgi:hypothetical protein